MPVYLAKSPIRNVYLDKFYVWPSCRKLIPAKAKLTPVIICPHCKTTRATMKTKFLLQGKYQSREEVKKLKEEFHIDDPNALHRGALKLLVEAIAEFER